MRPELKDPFGEGAAAARARRWRSLGIALGLVALIGLIFVISIVRLSSHVPLAE